MLHPMRRAAILVGVFASVLLGETHAAPNERPHVLFLLVDDLSWSDPGYNGSKTHQTPHIDRLALQGKVFTDFYSAGPVCSPTRASIMTGKSPARVGITRHLLSPQRDPKHMANHLDPAEWTIAESFADAGYATAYFGKWHLGYRAEHWAGQQGFAVAKGGIDLPWAWKLCYPDRDPPTARTWPRNHTRFFSPYHLTHLENGPENEYLTDRLTDETIRFIEQNKARPFFAFLSFHTVHTPLQAKADVVAGCEKRIRELGLDDKEEENNREKRYQNNANYAAMVHHLDENVGRLLERLEELELVENTIVVFTSDNGGKGSVTSNLPLRGAKHNLYEGGIRVPLVVRWPGHIAPGSSSSHPLISNDFYPTLLDLAGLELRPKQHVDGVSFKSILLDERDAIDRESIFWHYPHSRMEGAVRTGDWKLLLRHETGKHELYDLRHDLGERRDLADVQPDRVATMEAQHRDWRKRVGARFPVDYRQDNTLSPAEKSK